MQDRWLTSREAAKHLGYKPGTLKAARSTKILAGNPQPEYTRVGTSIRYKLSVLHEWMEKYGESVR